MTLYLLRIEIEWKYIFTIASADGESSLIYSNLIFGLSIRTEFSEKFRVELRASVNTNVMSKRHAIANWMYIVQVFLCRGSTVDRNDAFAL